MAPHADSGGHPARRTERILTPQRIRRAGWWTTLAGLTLGLSLIGVMLGCLVLFVGLVGPLAALMLGWVLAGLAAVLGHDWLSLGPLNRQLERELRAKLDALGELDFDPASADVYYVGLAHPSRVRPRRTETDDDLGFVCLDFDSLTYRGDQLSFAVSLDDVESVTLEQFGYGLPSSFKRLRVTFVDGEPFDAVLLNCREGDRLSTGNRATLTLYEALRTRLARRRHRRLSGLEAEPLAHAQRLGAD